MHSLLVKIAIWGASISVLNGQGVLRVKSGEVREINSGYNPSYLDGLVMEPRSTIKIGQDIRGWTVQIREAQFGQDTVLDARGIAGDPGADQFQIPQQAKYCQSGGDIQALAGGPAANGTPGRNLDILMGIKAVGHLTILTSGGNGGKGGRGGKGAKGGEASCTCDGGIGGTGGMGGSGGRGGDSSQVRIRWFPAGNFKAREYKFTPMPNADSNTKRFIESRLFVEDFPVGLEITGGPGSGGLGGDGGPEGYAGEAKQCALWAKGSGGAGSPGPRGPDNLHGAYHKPLVELIYAPILVNALIQEFR